MKKRILSMLLAIVMVVTLLPTAAFAEEETHHTCGDSCGHVDGDPHKTVEWTPWNSTTTLPSSGNYYLTENVTLSAQHTVSGTLNLCLNGHTITPSGSGFGAIKITGNLSLTDCQGNGKITGFTNDSGKGGAVYSEGTFTMYGGIISGNKVGAKYYTDSMGGGVYSEGTFTMYGGTISGNEAQRFGGGVYIAPGKQFTMSGGTISGNKVTTTGNAQTYGGGGVYVAGDTFTMTGGTISGNEAGRCGGGVCIGNNTDNKTSGTFTMSDGTISGNKAKYGGGVYIDSKKQFTMSDGTISGNTSSEYGGGVRVNGTFTMSNGTISGNNAGLIGGGVYIGPSASFTMTGGNITGNAATTYGGGVYMINDNTKFNLSGSPIISGNTGDNCYIYNDDTCMTVTDALSENAEIGITTWSSMSSRPFCEPADNSVDLSNYKNWFFSDSVDYAIAKNNDDGSLYTKGATTYSVLFASQNDYEKAKFTVRGIETNRAAKGDTVVISPKGDAVIESVTASGNVVVTDHGDGTYSFTMPTTTVIITVTFPAPTYSITYGDDGGAAVNGSYTTNVTNSILAGTSVTINPTPAPGYQVEDILVFKTDDTGTTVAVTNNTFTMPGYSVTVKVTFAPIEHDHCVCGEIHAPVGEHQQVEEKAFLPVSTEAQLQAAAESGGNVYLINDIAITNIDTVTVAAGKTLTLCLNGKKLSYAGPGKATIIKVAEDAILNITDCGTNTRAGYIDSTTKLWTEGTGNSSTDVECNLIGGVITGGTGSTTANRETYHAGAIKNSGTVYIYGGNIAGNQAIDSHGSGDGWGNGGAVFNATGADFYMYGGSVTGNYSNESIIYNSEENHFVFTGNAAFQHNTLTKNYSLISSNYGNGSAEISGNASFTHNYGGTVVKSFDEPLVVKGNASFTDNTVNKVIYYSYSYELADGKDFRMDGNILMERNTKPDDGSPAVDIDIYYISNNMPDALITLTAPLTRSYRIELPWYLKGGVLAKGDGTNVTNLTAADAEKLTDVDGRVIVAANDVVYIGRVILDQPTKDNNYTVAATDNPSYQWYEITTDTYPVTDEEVTWRVGSYDSGTGKWSATGLYEHYGYYFSLPLCAGDVITLVFDGAVDGVVEISTIQGEEALTLGEGNTYTYTAPFDGSFLMRVHNENSAAPAMLATSSSGTTYPAVTASVYGKVLPAVDGQTDAKLYTENLDSGTYVCEVTWPDDDPYILMSDTVEYHCHNYTYTASGNVITEKCTCGHEETATITAPTGNLTYDGAEKKATVAYSDGWQGGALTVSYTPGNVNAGSVTASITKENATASVQFEIEKLMHTVTYKAEGQVIGTVPVEHGKDATAPEIPAKEGYNETAPKWDQDGKNITADTVINAVYTKNQPGEYADVTPDTNVGGGKVAEEIEELKEKVPFTQEEEKQIEYGADVEVWLEIKDISDSVSSEDKAKVEEKLGDADVALYLDIAMFKQVGENEASRLTQLGDRVQICFKLADILINTDKDVTRTYSIIHVHDGKAEVITPVFDAATKTLTFETDRFSTYAVVYTDVENVPPTQETTPPTEETVPPTEKPAPPAETPATGDSFQPAFWIACMTLSIFGIAVLLLDAKRRHAR